MAKPAHAREGPDHAGETGLPDHLLDGLSRGARDFLLELLLFKSVYTSKWFRRLGAIEELRAFREEFDRLASETTQEAHDLSDELHKWDRVPGAPERLDEATAVLRRRLLGALRDFKSTTTEVFLAAAMQAPTAELRRNFIRLADQDRVHADRFRRLLGTPPPRETFERHPEGTSEGPPLGAHAERDHATSLRTAIARVITDLRAAGARPRRIALGPLGYRHLRDEGAVDERSGTAFGLPLDLDMSWRGECFSVETADRANLAELITAMRGGTDPPS